MAGTNELYDAAYALTRSTSLAKLFFQDDFLAFGVIDSVEELMPSVASLQMQNLLRPLKSEGRICWTLRTRDMAAKITALTQEEGLTYAQIEEHGGDGVWIRRIKDRTHLPQTTVHKCVKTLESRSLIKGFKSMKAPTQRTYILYHLAPNEDVVGGSWYSDGDLDTGMIREVGELIIYHVRCQSWAVAKSRVRVKRDQQASTDASTAHATTERDTTTTTPTKKRKRDPSRPTPDIEDLADPQPKSKHPRTETQLPYPHATHAYPPTASIHAWLTTSGALSKLKSSSLTVAEIQNVVDVLVWDDKLERVGDGYRSVLGVYEQGLGMLGSTAADEDDEDEDVAALGGGRGYTQAPCGRCPVFDLCEEGGPVNARECIYWARWLLEDV